MNGKVENKRKRISFNGISHLNILLKDFFEELHRYAVLQCHSELISESSNQY